ncbi:hypothetical protein M3Y99_00817300 [Aphelenchoides fujianensis]|nr:hypothetical protein M3Y99_00817300 [Aphelenchoides fujianensis]
MSSDRDIRPPPLPLMQTRHLHRQNLAAKTTPKRSQRLTDAASRFSLQFKSSARSRPSTRYSL